MELMNEMVLREKIERVLGEIKPMLQADGGDVFLESVSVDGVVALRILGSCPTCPGVTIPLIEGIKRIVKEQVPEVSDVIAV